MFLVKSLMITNTSQDQLNSPETCYLLCSKPTEHMLTFFDFLEFPWLELLSWDLHRSAEKA